MGIFSVALYFSVYSSTTSTLEAMEGLTPKQEHAIIDAQVGRARIALIAANAAGCLLAAGASYVIAGWTLRPIETAVDRQRRFTAHASHELRTPLTVMRGEIEVTMAHERSPQEYRETLDRIGSEIAILDSTTEQLLSLARLEAADSLSLTKANVGAAIGEVASAFRPDAATRRIDAVSQAPPDLEARLDWLRIKLILTNLLSNALRHVDEGGLIQVTASHASSNVELTVFNTGSPISEKDLPHVFEAFYRGTGGGEAGGSGLGLALCEWIAHVHGGSIAARNEAGGVAFVVTLPLQ